MNDAITNGVDIVIESILKSITCLLTLTDPFIYANEYALCFKLSHDFL